MDARERDRERGGRMREKDRERERKKERKIQEKRGKQRSIDPVHCLTFVSQVLPAYVSYFCLFPLLKTKKLITTKNIQRTD